MRRPPQVGFARDQGDGVWRMMVSNGGSLLRVLIWQWRYGVTYASLGAAAWLLHDVAGWTHFHIPVAPASIVGAALGIFASFRVNAAYARWWEGRQLWGKLVNSSRMLCSQTLAYVLDPGVREAAVRRQVLYIHVLRCQLRDDDPFADAMVLRSLESCGLNADQQVDMKRQTSLCHSLLDQTLRELAAVAVEPMRLQSIDQTLAAILDAQGGCERIKRTPMPRGYAFFVSQLLVLFAMLFPLAVVPNLGWAVIPVNLAVCLAFTLISETGRVLEDPFNHFWNSLPITSIAVTIERNLRQRLGDSELPPATTVDADGILW